MSETSFDVRFWKTEAYSQKSGKRYRVRWTVAGHRFARAFQNASLAESYKSSLVSAARKGEAFGVESCLPVSWEEVSTESPVTWLEHAMEFVDAKWADAAPKHRKSTAYGLMTVTVALTPQR